MDQSRTFYCLSENQCVTVWKRLGNKCYVIPGKYYGVADPTYTYIKTSNIQDLTLYFSIELPNTIVVRNQGSHAGTGEYKLKNSTKTDWKFVDYSEQFYTILYKPNVHKLNQVKGCTNYIDLDIKESYAIDKSGKKFGSE